MKIFRLTPKVACPICSYVFKLRKNGHEIKTFNVNGVLIYKQLCPKCEQIRQVTGKEN
ncbi:MAG: hypothetical protein ACFFG0_17795 [Candidatus Thorarchaeota archaeon]